MIYLSSDDINSVINGLRMIKLECNSRGSGESCSTCQFSVNSKGCMFKGTPCSWNLNYINGGDN